jgi:hypothetical protein
LLPLSLRKRQKQKSYFARFGGIRGARGGLTPHASGGTRDLETWVEGVWRG